MPSSKPSIKRLQSCQLRSRPARKRQGQNPAPANHEPQRRVPVQLTRFIAHSERWLLLLVVFAVWACRKEVPSAPPGGSKQAGPVVVENSGNWLFTYATPDGKFETTDKAEQVPDVSRGVVRAQSPGNSAAGQLATTLAATDVWVVNGA